jgi:hypothetical protein
MSQKIEELRFDLDNLRAVIPWTLDELPKLVYAQLDIRAAMKATG